MSKLTRALREKRQHAKYNLREGKYFFLSELSDTLDIDDSEANRIKGNIMSQFWVGKTGMLKKGLWSIRDEDKPEPMLITREFFRDFMLPKNYNKKDKIAVNINIEEFCHKDLRNKHYKYLISKNWNFYEKIIKSAKSFELALVKALEKNDSESFWISLWLPHLALHADDLARILRKYLYSDLSKIVSRLILEIKKEDERLGGKDE